MKLYDSTIKNGFFEVPYNQTSGKLRILFAKKYAPDALTKANGLKAKDLITKCLNKEDVGKDISSPEILNEIIHKGLESGKITMDEVIEMNTEGFNNIKSSEDIENETYKTLELFKAIINIDQIKDDKITALINSDVKDDFWLNQNLTEIEKELNSFRNRFSD